MVDSALIERHARRLPGRYYVELSFHTPITAELSHDGISAGFPSYRQYYVDVDNHIVLVGFDDEEEAMMFRLRFG